MYSEVYAYLCKTYLRNPLEWVGLCAELIRTYIIRVHIVIIAAQVTSDLAVGNYAGAKHGTVVFFVVYTLGAILGTFAELLCNYIENKEYGDLSFAYYQRLTGKDLSFYRDNQTGYLASVFRQHLDSAMTLIRFIRGDAFGVLLSLIIPPIVLYKASPNIGLAAAGIVVVQFLYILWSSRQAHAYRKITQEIYRKVTGEISDELTNIVAFKSGWVEHTSRTQVQNLIAQESAAFQARRRATTLLDFPRTIITACSISLAIYMVVSNTAVLNGQSLGLMVLTLTYMFQIVRNVGAVPELITTHDDLILKIYPTLQYVTSDHERVRDPEHPTQLNIEKGSIEISHVAFSYTKETSSRPLVPVFNDLNIVINGGERVGVVGLSGAGKSTLANLLLRFDDVQAGSISIDGVDIRSIRQTELRQAIAYVPQEPLLFHRNIRDNIAYFNPSATEDDILQAAKAAHAHDFILQLPDGYATLVGERGIKLSGGQKQRVAIARAILKKAPIMIFDEATSALDSESEQIIQRALPEILGSQTALVIAHRLSTVAGLDRILVMHEGAVIEEGTHSQLLKRGGRYAALWKKQTVEFAHM